MLRFPLAQGGPPATALFVFLVLFVLVVLVLALRGNNRPARDTSVFDWFIPRPKQFDDREMEAGVGYRMLAIVVTLVPGLYGVWCLCVGPVTWLGGAMRHDDVAKSHGWHLFFMGIFAVLVVTFLRAFLLPALLLGTPSKTSTLAERPPEVPAPSLEESAPPPEISKPIAQPEKRSISFMLWPFWLIGFGVIMIAWPDLMSRPTTHGYYHPNRSYSSKLMIHFFDWAWGRTFGVILIVGTLTAIWKRFQKKSG